MRKELINQLSTANYATSAGNSLLIVLERKMQEPQKYHFFIKILSVTASGNKLVRGVNSVRLLDLFSGTQRYKQAGNAVTVNVVQAVAEKIWPLKC